MVARVRAPSEARGRELFAAIRVLFGWLRRERIVAVSPVAALSPPRPASARDRVLSSAEISAPLARRRGRRDVRRRRPGSFLITGARLNEVAGMRWSELRRTTARPSRSRRRDRRTGGLTSCRCRRSRARSSRVSAGSRARDLVFSTTGRAPISGWGRAKRGLDAAVAANEPWTIHDLRRTAATNLAELGVRSDVVEAILNHARPGVAGTYNRSSPLAERRAALEAWGRRIAAIVGDVAELRPVVNSR